MLKLSEDAEGCAGCLSGCITGTVMFVIAIAVIYICIATIIGQF